MDIEIDEEYWDHLLNYVEANYESLQQALEEQYGQQVVDEPFNDRLEDA